MSVIQDIQKIALLSVLEPDDEANLRRIHRWFSKTFFLPLPEVENLPIEYILLHYFETLYAELDEEEQKKQVEYAIETEEERQHRIKNEEETDKEFVRMMNEEAKELKSKPMSKAELFSSFKVHKDKTRAVAIDESLLKKPEVPVLKEEEIKIDYTDSDLMDDIDSLSNKKS